MLLFTHVINNLLTEGYGMGSLKFFGGVNEIGGNKILLEEGDTRIWLDFGQSFNQGDQYFINWLQPRRSNGLKDYFEFGLMPEIPGLYSDNILTGTDLCYEDPCFQGVFISHAHADHVNHLKFIDPCIPVYSGKGTKFFMEAMEQTSSFADYGPHVYNCFRTGDIIRVDDFEFKPIHVDHSIPAAYGYIINTGENTIVYTGDIRAHGPRQDMTMEFLEAAAEVEPDHMICEGTRIARIGNRKNLSEEGVAKGLSKICKVADRDKKMVIFTQPSRDMDRWRTFYDAAKESSRILVIHPKTAFLLQRLLEDEHLVLPDPIKDDCIKIYYKRKRSGTYSEKDYYVWERDFLDKIVTSEEVEENPGRYIVNLDFYSFAELIDIRPKPGSHFIYSMSEPFTEEDLEEEVLHNWLIHFGLKYHQLHASGHMSKQELKQAVNRINPGKLYPVHTSEAVKFKDIYDKVLLPEIGKKFKLN
jgi:ribonuclease J